MSTEFRKEFDTLMQPVYAELLSQRGIPSGDITPGEAFAIDRAQNTLADAVKVWLDNSLADNEEDNRTATYHGIVRAECLTCGHVTTDITSLEIMNDQDPLCRVCGDETGSTKWTLQDGTTDVTTREGM